MDTQGTSYSHVTCSEVMLSFPRKPTGLPFRIPGPVTCQIEGYIQRIQHHIKTNKTLAD